MTLGRIAILFPLTLLSLLGDVRSLAHARSREPLTKESSTIRSSSIPSAERRVPPAPLLAYTLEAPLERQACLETEQHRKIQGRIGPAVIKVAAEQLNLPLGSGRFLSVNGRRYLFCLEPHYRAPGSGAGPTGWHKGVTVYQTADLGENDAAEKSQRSG